MRKSSSQFTIQTSLAHDIGDVSGEHEIHLGNWHHGRVATVTNRKTTWENISRQFLSKN